MITAPIFFIVLSYVHFFLLNEKLVNSTYNWLIRGFTINLPVTMSQLHKNKADGPTILYL